MKFYSNSCTQNVYVLVKTTNSYHAYIRLTTDAVTSFELSEPLVQRELLPNALSLKV